MASPVNSAGFSDALVILGAAGLVIPAFARLRVSPVIGFILVGLLVGPAGLGSFVSAAPWLFYVTISDPHGIEPFAELGIVLLLFSIGLELSFRRLWTMRRAVFGVGAAELLLSAAAIAGVVLALGYGWSGAIGVGLALALSSTALVIPIAGTDSPVGRTAFAMLLFEDLALVPIIFGLGSLRPGGEDVLHGMLMTLLRGGVTVAVLLVIGRTLLPRVFAQAARTKSPELFLSVSLLVVILASIATGAAGLSPIVGALVAGILIAETEYHVEVEVITAPFKGLALGVFLITVGMRLDLRQVAGHWPALLLATAAVVAIKTVVTSGLLRLLKFRMGVAAETGLLMAAPSETTLIVLGTATGAGLISGGTSAFWQICTALGLTITPLLAKAGRLLAGLIDRRAPLPVPAEHQEQADHTVVVGHGRVGQLVVDMLKRHDQPFSVVEADIDVVTRAREAGVPVLFGDVRRTELLDQLSLDTAKAVVLTMDDPVQLVRTTATVRRLFPDLPIVSRARAPAHAAELYRAGATEAVPETLESSLQLSGAVLVELGLAMGPVIASIHQKRAELRDQILRDGGTEGGVAIRRW